MSLFELVRQFGFEIGIIVFFIIQTYVRENRLTIRLEKIQDTQFDELRRLTMESLNTIKDNSYIINQLQEIVNEYKYSEHEHTSIIQDLKILIEENQKSRSTQDALPK